MPFWQVTRTKPAFAASDPKVLPLETKYQTEQGPAIEHPPMAAAGLLNRVNSAWEIACGLVT